MSIFSNTISICQFKVVGEPPGQDLYEWASRRLAKHSFRSIDDTIEEVSSGWVHLDDSSGNSFSYPGAFWHDHYLAFTLRRDQRRIPAVVFKTYLRKAESKFLAAHPNLRRVPKQKREELKQAVKASLYAKTLPMPSICDAVWDTQSGQVLFSNLSPKAVELFENHFKNTFDGLRLVMLHPFSRAERVVKDSLKPALLKANKASTGDVMNLIKDNQWLGGDFLLWLTYQTMNGPSEYSVNQPGPAQAGEKFIAFLNDRLVLTGRGEGSAQKVTVIGAQDRFSEVRAALKSGKQINEATLYLEKEENQWKMTLRSLMFHFASFKSPPVKLEKDNTVDEIDEKEAVFYERMYLLEEGIQLFDSLYAAFLEMRLSKKWTEEEKNIQKWLAAD